MQGHNSRYWLGGELLCVLLLCMLRFIPLCIDSIVVRSLSPSLCTCLEALWEPLLLSNHMTWLVKWLQQDPWGDHSTQLGECHPAHREQGEEAKSSNPQQGTYVPVSKCQEAGEWTTLVSAPSTWWFIGQSVSNCRLRFKIGLEWCQCSWTCLSTMPQGWDTHSKRWGASNHVEKSAQSWYQAGHKAHSWGWALHMSAEPLLWPVSLHWQSCLLSCKMTGVYKGCPGDLEYCVTLDGDYMNGIVNLVLIIGVILFSCHITPFGSGMLRLVSVDSQPCQENRSPGFDRFHLLCELVGTPPLTTTSEVCQISTLKLM